MPYNLDPSGALFWEDNPSTRQSSHLWTKWSPVDVTLAVAGTAENLFSRNTEVPTVNIATNPSMETGTTPPTSYTAVGATVTKSATVANSGTNSMSIDPDNSVAGEGAYFITPSLSGHSPDPNQLFNLVASAYFQDNADSSNTVNIEIKDTTGVTTHASGTELTLTSSWQRTTAMFQLPNTGAIYRIYFVTSTSASDPVFYVDDFQLELSKSSVASTYCDGAQGINYEWDGTAHASTSRRRLGLVSIRGYKLYTTHDCYVSLDNTASSTTGELVKAGTSFWTDFPIEANYISILNAVSGETPRVYGSIYGVHSGGRT
jgi:hypothetical protein